MKITKLFFIGVIVGLAWCLAPLATGDVVVSNATELADAITQANGGGDNTILLNDGTYTLGDMLYVTADGVTVRSASGNRDAVTIQGQGMGGGVSHIFNVAGSNFTARDMTLQGVGNHAIQLQIDVDGVVMHNLHILDTYEQMVKIAYDTAHPELSSDNGSMENCLLEYSAGIGPQYYIGGIDAHNAKNWVVRDNVFRGIRSLSGETAEYAIHFWSDSEDTVVERNIIINCDRGIGFGLGDRGHNGGIIRNNMIYHDSTEGFADVGISVESAPNAQVYNNTIYQEHSYPNAIEYRFPTTTGVLIANNLTNRAIAQRDGATATVSHNVTDAETGWFAHLFVGDLHLGYEVATVVNQGQAIDGLTSDIDEGARPYGGGYDIGADEYGSGTYDPIPGAPAPGGNEPVPDIIANGSDGPITVSRSDPVEVVVSLDPEAYSGQGADWWLVAETPSGLFYYTFNGWTTSQRPVHQGSLFSLESYEVFTADVSGLATWTYTLHFGVDTVADGGITWGSLYYDSVIVEIVE